MLSNTMNKNKRLLIATVKTMIPLVLLGIICFRVDFERCIQHISDLKLGFFAAAVALGFFTQVFLGALRWKLFLKKAYNTNIDYLFLLKHYWIGMFLGYFVPAGIGWDVYRVAKANGKAGKLLSQTTVVTLEKFMGLAACIVLSLSARPIAKELLVLKTPVILNLMNWLYFFGLFTLFLITLCFFFKKTSAVLLRKVESLLNTLLSKFNKEYKNIDAPDTLYTGLKTLVHPIYGTQLWTTTFLIRISASVGGYLILLSLNCNSPLIVNLFAIPIMGILFVLPISFGSIGVREGAFILLYGLFGIEEPLALAASFIGLFALLLTISIGELLWLSTA